MENQKKNAPAENGETASPEPKAEKSGEKEKKGKDDVKSLKTELAGLKTEVEAAKKELAEEKDKYLRLAAEYDNFRKRSQKEKDELYGVAVSDTVKVILPIIDNLERAAKLTDAEKIVEGLGMLVKTVDGAFAKLRVERFGAPGEEFDPALHEAVSRGASEEYTEDQITDVFQPGYRRDEKIIRVAMVKVAE
ncbi:MAG: nucleotide exchange factor GrpE [Clostridia bacterium]|nr:nucleotide exchange factor GrpE [Clostridia bacterium]